MPAPNQTTYDDNTKERARELYLSNSCPSFTEIARILELPRPSTVREWARKGNWEQERADKFKSPDAALVRTELQQFVKQTVDEMLLRHVANGVALQEKAVEWLNAVAPKTVQEVVQMMTYGVELERGARGLSGLGNKKGGDSGAGLSADVILASFKQIVIQSGSPEARALAEVIDGTTVQDSTPPNQSA